MTCLHDTLFNQMSKKNGRGRGTARSSARILLFVFGKYTLGATMSQNLWRWFGSDGAFKISLVCWINVRVQQWLYELVLQNLGLKVYLVLLVVRRSRQEKQLLKAIKLKVVVSNIAADSPKMKCKWIFKLVAKDAVQIKQIDKCNVLLPALIFAIVFSFEVFVHSFVYQIRELD